MVNLARAGFNPERKFPGLGEWGCRKWDLPNIGDCTFVIDAGFNGGSLCSFNWPKKYIAYLLGISEIPKSLKHSAKQWDLYWRS